MGKGLLDQFTRSDELLEDVDKVLNDIKYILSKQQERQINPDPRVIVYPTNYKYAYSDAGTVTLDFFAGTVTDVNGNVTALERSLAGTGHQYCSSVTIYVSQDADIYTDQGNTFRLFGGQELPLHGITLKKISLSFANDGNYFAVKAATSPDFSAIMSYGGQYVYEQDLVVWENNQHVWLCRVDDPRSMYDIYDFNGSAWWAGTYVWDPNDPGAGWVNVFTLGGLQAHRYKKGLYYFIDEGPPADNYFGTLREVRGSAPTHDWMEMAYSTNLTTKGTYYGVLCNSKRWREADYYLECTSLAGVTPTLDVSIESYDPAIAAWAGGNPWYTVATFAQLAAAGTEAIQLDIGLGWWQRAVYVLADAGGAVTDCDFRLGVVYKE